MWMSLLGRKWAERNCECCENISIRPALSKRAFAKHPALHRHGNMASSTEKKVFLSGWAQTRKSHFDLGATRSSSINTAHIIMIPATFFHKSPLSAFISCGLTSLWTGTRFKFPTIFSPLCPHLQHTMPHAAAFSFAQHSMRNALTGEISLTWTVRWAFGNPQWHHYRCEGWNRGHGWDVGWPNMGWCILLSRS